MKKFQVALTLEQIEAIAKALQVTLPLSCDESGLTHEEWAKAAFAQDVLKNRAKDIRAKYGI